MSFFLKYAGYSISTFTDVIRFFFFLISFIWLISILICKKKKVCKTVLDLLWFDFQKHSVYGWSLMFDDTISLRYGDKPLKTWGLSIDFIQSNGWKTPSRASELSSFIPFFFTEFYRLSNKTISTSTVPLNTRVVSLSIVPHFLYSMFSGLETSMRCLGVYYSYHQITAFNVLIQLQNWSYKEREVSTEGSSTILIYISL